MKRERILCAVQWDRQGRIIRREYRDAGPQSPEKPEPAPSTRGVFGPGELPLG